MRTPPPASIDRPLEALMVRIRAGDEAGLRDLYERTSRRLFGIVLAIVGDRTSAEEVLVEVYTQVWRQAGRYDPERGSVHVWLATIARTRAIDRLRALHPRRSAAFD